MSWPGRPEGFSLIEVVIALGVISFALVGILALFPIAINSAAESKAETRIADIAQAVFTDLKKSLPSKAQLVASRSGTGLENATIKSLDLTVATDSYMVYDQDGVSMQEVSSGSWTGKATVPRAVYIAWLHVDPNPAIAAVSGLSQVRLMIEYPALADQVHRKHYEFVCLLGNR
jgi:uncharacterized protein (TIGR02598 family)